MPSQPTTPIELFTTLLAHKLRYEPHERDMVVLHHELVAKSAEADAVEEIHTSSLIVYGTEAGSAMSRCVGLPVAFATLQVLDGHVRARGVVGPTDKSVYGSVLRGLEEVGLGMTERVRHGMGMEGILVAGLTQQLR
jgi:alpha-aminoadipic semialdehyde synthase